MNVSGTLPPLVKITAPTEGDRVSETVLLTVEVSKKSSFENVEFYIDDKLIKNDDSEPFSFLWNTIEFPNGVHTFRARALDQKGNFAESKINIIVKNE